MEVWSIEEPFDTILLCKWPKVNVEQLIVSLSTEGTQPQIAEALSPLRAEKKDYNMHNIVKLIIEELCKSKNLCDPGTHCNNIMLHHSGLKCVTAAAIRMRLQKKFDLNLGTLKHFDFQRSIVKSLNICTVRNNLGILLIHCPHQEGLQDGTKHLQNNLLHHIMKVIYDNFYLYTAPLCEEYLRYHADKVRMFIGNQIFRNADCIVILVDDEMIRQWNSDFGDHVLHSLGWQIKLKVLVIGVSPDSQEIVECICKSLDMTPRLITYEQLLMAPSGGLISLIKRLCTLDLKDTFMKYIYRANVVLRSLESIDRR